MPINLITPPDSSFSEEINSTVVYTTHSGYKGIGISAAYHFLWSTTSNIALGIYADYNLAYISPDTFFWPSIGISSRLKF